MKLLWFWRKTQTQTESSRMDAHLLVWHIEFKILYSLKNWVFWARLDVVGCCSALDAPDCTCRSTCIPCTRTMWRMTTTLPCCNWTKQFPSTGASVWRACRILRTAAAPTAASPAGEPWCLRVQHLNCCKRLQWHCWPTRCVRWTTQRAKIPSLAACSVPPAGRILGSQIHVKEIVEAYCNPCDVEHVSRCFEVSAPCRGIDVDDIWISSNSETLWVQLKHHTHIVYTHIYIIYIYNIYIYIRTHIYIYIYKYISIRVRSFPLILN